MLYASPDKIKKFYLYASLFVATGWLWLLLSLTALNVDVCLFRNVTGLDCPACGGTTAVMHMLQGEFATAFFVNPFSYLLLPGLIVVPLWLFWDKWVGSLSFYVAVARFDAMVRKRPVVLVLLLLVIVVRWVLKFN